MDGGEHIGQMANFLYATWRITGYLVEGRLPRSRQRLWVAPPGVSPGCGGGGLARSIVFTSPPEGMEALPGDLAPRPVRGACGEKRAEPL